MMREVKLVEPVTAEERIACVLNCLMLEVSAAYDNAVECNNQIAMSRRDAQIEILEELEEKLCGRGFLREVGA